MSLKSSVQNEGSRKLRTVYGACPHDCPDCCALEMQVDEQGQAGTSRDKQLACMVVKTIQSQKAGFALK
jgi:hypothetical protein